MSKIICPRCNMTMISISDPHSSAMVVYRCLCGYTLPSSTPYLPPKKEGKNVRCQHIIKYEGSAVSEIIANHVLEQGFTPKEVRFYVDRSLELSRVEVELEDPKN